MKDHVEIGHSTKFDDFRVNRDQVMDLEIWFKIHTNVSNFETVSPQNHIFKIRDFARLRDPCLKIRDRDSKSF